jgi:hypothetical protein
MQVPPPPPAIVVTATPAVQNGVVTWTLCVPAGCSSGPSFPPLEMKQGAAANTIQVSINDPNQTGITFAAGQSAMWVQPGFACPTSAGWNSGSPPQLTGFTRVDNTHIQFSDANSNASGGGPVYFTYRLNFVNSSGQAVKEIDPIIRNGGRP